MPKIPEQILFHLPTRGLARSDGGYVSYPSPGAITARGYKFKWDILIPFNLYWAFTNSLNHYTNWHTEIIVNRHAAASLVTANILHSHVHPACSPNIHCVKYKYCHRMSLQTIFYAHPKKIFLLLSHQHFVSTEKTPEKLKERSLYMPETELSVFSSKEILKLIMKQEVSRASPHYPTSFFIRNQFMYAI